MADESRLFLPKYVRQSAWVTVVLVVTALISFLPLIMYVYYGTVQRNLAFTVSSSGVSVNYRVGRIDIPVEDIAAVTYVPSPPRLRRTAGAGLFGLQMGWYRLDDYGRVYRLTTVERPVVYVDTTADAQRARPSTRYVFSPDDADQFADLLQTVLAGGDVAAEGGVAAATATFRTAPGRSVAGDPVLLLAIFLTVPWGIALPLLARKGPRAMRYRVGFDGIKVHHFGTKLYRWDSINDVRVFNGPLRRMRRVFGAAWPGYYTGSFRAGDLGTIDVYATRLKPPLVLLETGVRKVMLSPQDVDGFLQAVEKYRHGSN